MSVRIITTCQNGRGRGTVEGNREYMLGVTRRALTQKPDLLCLPETFTDHGVPAGMLHNIAEPVPGPTTDAFAKLAKANNCYIICPIRTLRNGRQWNTAVVIDRRGDILGLYDKCHPVTSSIDYTVFEEGCTPGGKPPVFDLDFGRIGIQICFDAGYPETWRALAEQGVRAVFWPSAYPGGFSLQAYAYLHHVFVVTSCKVIGSRIIDPCGRVIRETDDIVDYAAHDLSLDFAVAHYDFNNAIPDRLMEAYPGKVRISSYVNDGHFIVEALDPALKITDLQKQFGFEPSSRYFDRHRAAYPAVRAGDKPSPQSALHGNRPQWSK